MTSIDLVDPATGETFGTAPACRESEVDAAVQRAATAFTTWRRSTPMRRQAALLAIADAIEAGAHELADLECRETGKDRAVVLDEEIPQSADVFRFFAGAARTMPGAATGEYLDGHTSSLRREPIGVIAQITPWNYPLMMAVWKIAPAVAAGNTVVVKPADTTPSSTVLLGALASRHLPEGVVNVVTGDRDTGRLLVTHPIPAMVSITGSTRAGIEVARAAADTVKRTHLELGGNAPALVFDDADVAEAADGIIAAAFYNAGQDCTAASRVLLQDRVHDEFVAALTVRAEAARTGPLNSAAQLERVTGLVDRLPGHAVVHCGGKRLGERGFFMAPTVISGLRQYDEIVQEEVFAPVVTVQRFTTEQDGVTSANGVPQGLASSVWTADATRAARVAVELDFGCVWVNTHGPLVPEMPHGGFGRSGYGKDLSTIGLEDYTRVKHVMTRSA
ncbi:aminobutyraldehyde dehydrogenase [Kibdelosporangium phytohabitans]|uniref:Phenylacetaldehyde dehydrogenase n=1 Tax=Kibdelosporangium phytohabitans TaxID=860235 RepID=A0A0N9I6M2_9PSEU|nr:aminobutyraldehyde dehydrogenase [Kibdelosporangium phytohabitans]ALG11660.1 phenylacetaldehyde dehydrogenase [Kibdelosporangium phytohabitans]MBE1463047.1 1-pyrroline dehydrogenase [Kibdelosporangium phytohabitans]